MIDRIDQILGLARHRLLFDVGVAHGCFDVGVTEDLLDLVQVQAVLDQACRVGMSQGVSGTSQ